VVRIQPFILDYKDDETATTAEASSSYSSDEESEVESSGESGDEQEGHCTAEWSAQPPQHWGLEYPRAVLGLEAPRLESGA
jgi:hypothetical protein